MADLYSSDSLGVYIPQDFAESVHRDCVSGVSDSMWEVLERGPEDDAYWDVWDRVLRDAVINDFKGRVGFLWQEGDLWVIWGEEDPDFKSLCGEDE
jgi:hypothetical protein